MVIRIDIGLTILIGLIQVIAFFRWKLTDTSLFGQMLLPVGTWRNGALLTRLRFMAMTVIVLWVEFDYLHGRSNLPFQFLLLCLLMLGQYVEPWLVGLIKKKR